MKPTGGRGFVTALALSMTACAGDTPQAPGDLTGAWETEGYGHVVEVADGRARFFEVTAVSCIATWEMTLGPPLDEESEASLDFPDVGMSLGIQAAGSDDERWLRLEGLASRRRLRRIDGVPDRCSAEAPSDAVSVFDTFWQTYAEHYPFFAMKDVDWERVRDTQRPPINADTSPEDLFEIFVRMIEPLEDAHTYVSAGDIRRGFGGRRPDRNPLGDESIARALEIITGRYLAGPLTMLCNDQIGVGRLQGGARYMALGSFNGYGDDFADGMVCLEDALDRLLDDPDAIRAVVLDVRVNDGGADPYGLAIASRLASTEYLAYTKETRNDPDDATSWSEGQPSFVRPSSGTNFHGPVVLLTGPRSVSAAETFTMALMGRTPAVTRIGGATQGVFSDVMNRALPNGWSFGLPNERFLTADGRSLDGPGVPPDIETPVFTPEDLESGLDSALEAALVVIGASTA